MQQGEATDPRLREAARKLIGAYMADESLAPHINALEAAAGFCEQGQERRAPEPEWEYRAIRGHAYSGAWPSEAKARYHGALGFGPDTPFTIERRRKVGEWEALPDD